MKKAPLFTLLFLLCASVVSAQSDPLIVKHYQTHERYEFGIQLLDLALSKLDTPYEIQTPELSKVNEARGHHLVEKGFYDVQFLMTSPKLEETTIPIKIPVYRGLLGLRLMLIKPENRDMLESVSDIEGLRQYQAGHGKHWSDLPIYAANDLRVQTNVSYEALFKQLKAERFDYFHRGINEIWAEYETHADDLTIADNVMLFYSHPVYFFVTKQRPELAEKLEKGLNMAIEDGSFKALFFKYHGEMIENAKMDGRNLIVLQNPSISAETAAIDTSWWLPQKFQNQVSTQVSQQSQPAKSVEQTASEKGS